MKVLRSWLIFSIRVLVLTLFVSISAHAQPPDPFPPDTPPSPEGPPVPLTGLEILLVSGAALGGYKAYRKSVAVKAESENR